VLLSPRPRRGEGLKSLDEEGWGEEKKTILFFIIMSVSIKT